MIKIYGSEFFEQLKRGEVDNPSDQDEKLEVCIRENFIDPTPYDPNAEPGTETSPPPSDGTEVFSPRFDPITRECIIQVYGSDYLDKLERGEDAGIDIYGPIESCVREKYDQDQPPQEPIDEPTPDHTQGEVTTDEPFKDPFTEPTQVDEPTTDDFDSSSTIDHNSP